jgi:Ca2+/Na+ antiporter
MNRNAILDNLDDIPDSVPVSASVSAPVSAPSLIETNLNNDTFLQQLLSNKIYIYIIIGIIILAIVSYYLYIKYFYKSEKEVEPEIELEPEPEPEPELEPELEKERKKHIISPDIEYYLLDSSKNPILIHNPAISFKRPKLTHPNEENISDNEDNEDYEDNNITNQDLTRDEIEDLENQLEIMQKKQNTSITAENDEDNEGAF